MKNQVKYPCRGCVYFNVCGENTRTHPCDGRKTKSEVKKKNALTNAATSVRATSGSNHTNRR